MNFPSSRRRSSSVSTLLSESEAIERKRPRSPLPLLQPPHQSDLGYCFCLIFRARDIIHMPHLKPKYLRYQIQYIPFHRAAHTSWTWSLTFPHPQAWAETMLEPWRPKKYCLRALFPIWVLQFATLLWHFLNADVIWKCCGHFFADHIFVHFPSQTPSGASVFGNDTIFADLLKFWFRGLMLSSICLNSQVLERNSSTSAPVSSVCGISLNFFHWSRNFPFIVSSRNCPKSVSLIP